MKTSQWKIAGLICLATGITLIASMATGNFFPFRSTARRHDLEKSVMKGLEIAVKGYKAEYGTLPPGVVDSDHESIETRGELLAILIAEHEAKNTRSIRLFEMPPERRRTSGQKNAKGEWELRDPQGNFYRMHLDVNQDGRIPNPAAGSAEGEAVELISDVIVYSAGQDGDFSTWKDNVRSWQ